MPNQHNPKITDEQFKEALTECNGNVILAKQYIYENYGISCSKQALYQRAGNFPEVIDEVIDLFDHHCMAKLIVFADDETEDKRFRARLYVQMLNRLDRYRRFKLLTDNARGVQGPRQVYKLHGKIIDFGKQDGTGE